MAVGIPVYLFMEASSTGLFDVNVMTFRTCFFCVLHFHYSHRKQKNNRALLNHSVASRIRVSLHIAARAFVFSRTATTQFFRSPWELVGTRRQTFDGMFFFYRPVPPGELHIHDTLFAHFCDIRKHISFFHTIVRFNRDCNANNDEQRLYFRAIERHA